MVGMYLTIETDKGEVITGRCVRILSPCSMHIQTEKGPRFLFQFEFGRIVGCTKFREG